MNIHKDIFVEYSYYNQHFLTYSSIFLICAEMYEGQLTTLQATQWNKNLFRLCHPDSAIANEHPPNELLVPGGSLYLFEI